MAWKLKTHRTSRGRYYWTIEDASTRRFRSSDKGGISRYWNHDDAKRERDRLRRQDAQKAHHNPAEDIDVIEPYED